MDHLNRYVSNVDQFIDFYINVLDYQLLDKGMKSNGHNYAILKGLDHELFISERDAFEIDRDQNFRHVGYAIDNVDALLDRLKRKGYIREDISIIIKPYSRQFYIKDPDGFEIDLIQWTDKQGLYRFLKDKDA